MGQMKGCAGALVVVVVREDNKTITCSPLSKMAGACHAGAYALQKAAPISLLPHFPNFLHKVLPLNGEKHSRPLPALHSSTLLEYLRAACLPFVTLTGGIAADSNINVLLLLLLLRRQIVLTEKQRC